MDILLVRHGNNPTPSPLDRDPDLTETGVFQAQQLGQRLRALDIDRIYTSNIKRALHTAQIINQTVQAPLSVHPELREINMGRLNDAPWAAVENDFPGYYENWRRHDQDLPYPDGECGEDVARRVLPLIDEIVSQGKVNRAKRVVIVTHGGVIRSLLCAILGLGQEKRFRFGAPLENCSITELRWNEDENQFSIHAINDTGHLKP